MLPLAVRLAPNSTCDISSILMYISAAAVGICLQVQRWKWGHLYRSTQHTVQMWRHPGALWAAELWPCHGNGSSATCQNCSTTFRISGIVPAESWVVSCRCPMRSKCCSALQLHLGKPHLLQDNYILCCFPSELQITAEDHWSTWKEPLFLTNICSGLLQRPDSEYLTGRSWLGELYSYSRVMSQDWKQMPSHFAQGKMKPCSSDWLHR